MTAYLTLTAATNHRGLMASLVDLTESEAIALAQLLKQLSHREASTLPELSTSAVAKLQLLLSDAGIPTA